MRMVTVKTRSGKDYTFDAHRYGDPNRIDLRKTPPAMKKGFQVAEMHELHHEIARRLVLTQKPKDIAAELGCAYTTVISVKNSPVVQEQIRLLQGAQDATVIDVTERIRNLAPKAVEVLESIMNDEDASANIRSKNALAILDRAGHAPPKNVNIKGVVATVSADDLVKIKQRAAEIGITE